MAQAAIDRTGSGDADPVAAIMFGAVKLDVGEFDQPLGGVAAIRDQRGHTDADRYDLRVDQYVWYGKRGNRSAQPLGDGDVQRIDVAVSDAGGAVMGRATMVRPPPAPIAQVRTGS